MIARANARIETAARTIDRNHRSRVAGDFAIGACAAIDAPAVRDDCTR
jgi:hypothetical protein